MANRHHRSRMFSSPAGNAATAAVAVAVAVGGTVGAVRLTSSEPAEARPTPAVATPAPQGTVPGTPSAAPSPTGSPSPSATASPATARSTAASRNRPRAASTPTRRATPKPTTPKPTAPKVVDSGTCGASFYAEGQLTANGENFDPEAMTAAHRTLPFGTRVRVTNPDTGAAITVRINDRGPFIDGRCIDLSRAAFRAIASLDLGHLTVRYEVLG